MRNLEEEELADIDDLIGAHAKIKRNTSPEMGIDLLSGDRASPLKSTTRPPSRPPNWRLNRKVVNCK